MEEEKKMKTIKIEVSGYEEFLKPKVTEEDGKEWYDDAYSRYAYDEMVFDVDGKEYTPDDFSPAEEILSTEQLKEFKDFDVEKFFEDSGADYGMLYVNKAWATIEIEIPEDEEFDPKKAAVVVREYLNFDSDYAFGTDTVCAFAYDGKVYDCNPEDSVGKWADNIWKSPHKWGYIDKSGKWVIEPKYKEAYPFSEGLAKVCSDGLYGFIDRSGAWVIKPKFKEVDSFSDGMAKVKVDDKYGYIDKHGTMVIEPKYDKAESFSEGLALAKKNEQWGFINRKGELVFNIPYELTSYFYLLLKRSDSDMGMFKNGIALLHVKDPKGFAFIDKNGEGLIESNLENAGVFSEGLAYAKSDDKNGFIDNTGEWIIETKFGVLGDFHEGVASVKVDDKAGFIDKKGNWIIEPQFEADERELEDMDFDGDYRFSEGLAAVTPKRAPIPENDDEEDWD